MTEKKITLWMCIVVGVQIIAMLIFMARKIVYEYSIDAVAS